MKLKIKVKQNKCHINPATLILTRAQRCLILFQSLFLWCFFIFFRLMTMSLTACFSSCWIAGNPISSFRQFVSIIGKIERGFIIGMYDSGSCLTRFTFGLSLISRPMLWGLNVILVQLVIVVTFVTCLGIVLHSFREFKALVILMHLKSEIGEELIT